MYQNNGKKCSLSLINNPSIEPCWVVGFLDSVFTSAVNNYARAIFQYQENVEQIVGRDFTAHVTLLYYGYPKNSNIDRIVYEFLNVQYDGGFMYLRPLCIPIYQVGQLIKIGFKSIALSFYSPAIAEASFKLFKKLEFQERRPLSENSFYLGHITLAKYSNQEERDKAFDNIHPIYHRCFDNLTYVPFVTNFKLYP